ncbi:MAG: cache domain-containing protein [Acidobacteria bacterium]|nr:cache domain-containing protein [Acidobacteriota bacterium]
MGKRRYELDTRILTIFFFVAMPFVAFGSFLVVTMARGALMDTLGQSFEQRAFESKFLLERYVSDQVDHLRVLALDPQVHSTLAALGKPRSADEAKKLEQAWASGTDAKLTAPLLGSPLAARLRDMVQVYPPLRLVQVVDAGGTLVAASNRGGRLQSAETPWFKALVLDGTHSAYVGDIQRPAGGTVALLEVAYPVYDEDGRFLGAVRSLVDAAHLYSVLAPVRVGRTGHATLVRATDGTILASNESERILRGSFRGFAQIEAAIRERRGYWAVPEIREQAAGGEALVEPARLVGYSVVEHVPGVQWLLVVEQDLTEATAPIQQVTRFLWIHFVGAFAAVILLALYLSFKLEAPVIDEELHLHEQHVPSSMRPTAEM